MFETRMTVVGKLATAVDQRRLADGSAVASFRIVSAERRYDRAVGGWSDGDKLFLDVTCWRRLAENTFASLVKGDAVVVTGRLYTREFEHEGRRRSTVALEAQSVAADLAWCTAVLNRTGRRATVPADAEIPAAATPDAVTPDAVTPSVRTPDDARRAPCGAGALPGGPGDRASAPEGDAARLVGAVPGGEG